MVCNGIQVIHKNENVGRCSKETNSVNTVIHTKRISGCLEVKYFGRFGSRVIGI